MIQLKKAKVLQYLRFENKLHSLSFQIRNTNNKNKIKLNYFEFI